MNSLHKSAIPAISIVFVVLAVLGMVLPNVAQAATSPSLGAAASYSVLSGAGATNGGAGSTTISGDLGVSPAASYTDGGTTVFLTAGNPHLADVSAGNAQSAQLAVFNGPLDFAQQPCTVTYAVTTELSTVGPLVPGVYCTDPGMDFTLSGTLTLQGTGTPATDVWIFRTQRDLIGSGTANVVFTGTGGLPCNVWWRVANTATFTANNAMVGNILAATDITFGQSATLNGRAFAYTGAVTLLGNTISGPTCTAAVPATVPTGYRIQVGSINVVKTVINDNARTKKISDFPLFVNGASVSSGATNIYPATYSAYTVTETSDPNYIRSFSGDCDVNGNMTLIAGDNKVCIVTNDDIGAPVPVPPVPPLIEVVKVPNPLALPNGSGLVEYTYTLRNIGTVPVTDITMVGDTCSPIILVSGDTNNDLKMDLNEAWVHTCSATLIETHTNTVVATGWANGISAIDIASATVVVGEPVVPPLIHVTKTPNPLTLPVGGGMVTFTKKVTNPGIVALNNVRITDDMCSLVTYISGDVNGDSKLDVNETWTYTCRANLKKSTTNTVSVSGEANGLIARDFAVATVVVASVVPTLPNTGFVLMGINAFWSIVLIAGILSLISISLVVALRRRT